MDAHDALNQLLEVSEEIRAAVVFELGEPIASNLEGDDASEVAGRADAMLAYASTLRTKTAVTELQAATPDGDVYVTRQGERGVVAIATPGSLPGLVQHDLRTLLGSLQRSRRRSVVTA